jgi:hypothetical protein
MRDACSRRPVRHLIALSIRRRSRLSSSYDSHRTPTHSALLSPSASTPSLSCSSAPSAEASTTPHHSRAPLSHAKSAAEPPSIVRNYQSTKPTASFGCRDRLPIECHLQPSMCSSITATTSARAHRRSTNPEPAPSTSSPTCRRRFPTINLLRRHEPTTVSPSTAYAPNQDPHLWGELPGTSFPGHSSPVGRQAARRWGTGELPCFGRAGQKAQLGQAIFTA